MSTKFAPIEIPPGVVANGTKKQRSSNWSEVNLIRWSEGQLSPVMGQSPYAYTFASRCRRIHTWYDLNSVQHTAYLCERHLYVDTGSALTDITPTGGITAPAVYPSGYSDGNYSQGGYLAAASSFTTTSTAITMAAPNPGWVVPDLDVSIVDPADPNHGIHVGKVLTYTGTTLTLAAASAVASLSAADTLNFGAYSEPRPFGIAPPDQLTGAYSLANFGGILLAMTSWDGRLLFWDPLGTPGTKAAPVVAASGKGVVPTGRCFVVTGERFVQIFGAYDAVNGGGFRRFAWCEQEDYTNWLYTDPTTQAGFIDIEPSSPIVTAVSTRNGTLFWTAKKAYVSRYLGLPYVYNYVELADACTPWSPQSVTTTSSMAVWVSQQGAFSYDGTSILPVTCRVRAWVDDDIDLLNVREQSFATHVANYNEVWWFFPQSGQSTNTRCIIYNYKEGWWSQGRMSRSAGITASYTSHTIMADGFTAYQHELGVAYGGAPEPPWAETFDLNVNSGASLTTVKQMLPDVEGAASGVRYSLFYQTPVRMGRGSLNSRRRASRSARMVMSTSARPAATFACASIWRRRPAASSR